MCKAIHLHLTRRLFHYRLPNDLPIEHHIGRPGTSTLLLVPQELLSIMASVVQHRHPQLRMYCVTL
jgi:hypothetical protein